MGEQGTMANILYWRTNCEAELRATVQKKKLTVDGEAHNISDAMALMDDTDHNCIITASYTELGESLADVLTMMSLFRKENINVLFLDTGISLLSAEGETLENALMTWCGHVVQQERQLRAASRRAYPLRSRGRPPVTVTPTQVREARKRLSISQTARWFGIGESTVKKLQRLANEQSLH